MSTSTMTLNQQSAIAIAGAANGTSVAAKDTEIHVHGMLDKTSLQAMSHGDALSPGIPNFSTHAEKRQWQLEHMAAASDIGHARIISRE